MIDIFELPPQPRVVKRTVSGLHEKCCHGLMVAFQQGRFPQPGELLGKVEVETDIYARFHRLIRGLFRVLHEYHCTRRGNPPLAVTVQDRSGRVLVFS